MKLLKTCAWYEDGEPCINMCEGNTDFCGSHNAMQRKAARMKVKSKIQVPVKKITAEHARELQDYGVLRRIYLRDHQECEARIASDCDGHSQEIHHASKRGENLLKPDTFMAVCRPCHIFIETKMSAEERREKGFLITKNETV